MDESSTNSVHVSDPCAGGQRSAAAHRLQPVASSGSRLGLGVGVFQRDFGLQSAPTTETIPALRSAVLADTVTVLSQPYGLPGTTGYQTAVPFEAENPRISRSSARTG